MAEEDKSVSDTGKDVPDEKEVKARGFGHRTKEEWEAEGKDPEAWVDADEFIRRAPLFEKNRKLSKTVKKLETTVAKLMEHNSAIEKASYEKALKDLAAQKKVAASENDVAKVVEIDERIEEVKEKKKAAIAEPKADDVEEMMASWREDNPWYGADKDEDMFAYANGIGSKLETEHGPNSEEPWPHAKILKEVTKRTLKAFEWKTKNLNREAPGKVGAPKGNEATPRGSKLPTYGDLPKEAQETYREWVKTDKNPQGIMTKEEFLRQYALRAGLIKEDQDND